MCSVHGSPFGERINPIRIIRFVVGRCQHPNAADTLQKQSGLFGLSKLKVFVNELGSVKVCSLVKCFRLLTLVRCPKRPLRRAKRADLCCPVTISKVASAL